MNCEYVNLCIYVWKKPISTLKEILMWGRSLYNLMEQKQPVISFFITDYQSITVSSHDRHGISNHQLI